MIGGEYPGEGMFGGMPFAAVAPPPPPPTGLPHLSMPSMLTVVQARGLSQLSINEYDTALRIVI